MREGCNTSRWWKNFWLVGSVHGRQYSLKHKLFLCLIPHSRLSWLKCIQKIVHVSPVRFVYWNRIDWNQYICLGNCAISFLACILVGSALVNLALFGDPHEEMSLFLLYKINCYTNRVFLNRFSQKYTKSFINFPPQTLRSIPAAYANALAGHDHNWNCEVSVCYIFLYCTKSKFGVTDWML